MFTSILIAIGLNFDTFSVAIVEGSQTLKSSTKNSFKVGLFFGIGQAFMALIGVFLGLGFKLIITNIDHWIAFVLLCFVGGKLIYDSIKQNNCIKLKKSINLVSLFSLVVATSIDAVSVGITFAFMNESIATTILLIGVITFVVSFFGYYFGKGFEKFCKSKIKIIGGLILMFIGFKILIQHLFFGS
ncbi:MAG: manganese efflux pump MntP family protein [bacterium]|nr:manganese efflux pump MntP family protein [bacterium]